MSRPAFELEFFQDDDGTEPVLRWIKEELTPTKRRAIGTAMNEVLQHLGQDVCGTEYGKSLGGGLFEFRLRHSVDELRSRARVRPGGAAGAPKAGAASGRAVSSQPTPPREPAGRGGPGEKILLRVFCHAHGQKVILLLGGYDKGADGSRKRQQAEIALARKRLAAWKRRQG